MNNENNVRDNRPKGLSISSLISKTAQTENTNNFEMLPIEKLVPFYDHPFKPYTETELADLVESIKEIGIIHPVVVRKKQDGKFEILSGHNRTEAAKLAGLRDVPTKILNVDDDTAKMIVTETNLKQREKICHSDKAKAYKMQLDALKNQGKRKDLLSKVDDEINFGSIGPEVEGSNNNFRSIGPEVKYARDIVADRNNTSAKQISRYIRLSYLHTGLLDKVDKERIPLRSGVELSYINEVTQGLIDNILNKNEELSISIQVASALKMLPEAQLENLNEDELAMILIGKESNKQGVQNQSQPKKFVPFKMAFKAAEKQFKEVDAEIASKLDEKKLEEVVVQAIKKYIADLNV